MASRGLAFGKAELVYEHAIPMKNVQDALLRLPATRPELVRETLDRMLVACIITAQEDRKLRLDGVAARMPADWDEIDPLARYEHAKIAVELNPKFSDSIGRPEPHSQSIIEAVQSVLPLPNATLHD